MEEDFPALPGAPGGGQAPNNSLMTGGAGAPGLCVCVCVYTGTKLPTRQLRQLCVCACVCARVRGQSAFKGSC